MYTLILFGCRVQFTTRRCDRSACESSKNKKLKCPHCFRCPCFCAVCAYITSFARSYVVHHTGFYIVCRAIFNIFRHSNSTKTKKKQQQRKRRGIKRKNTQKMESREKSRSVYAYGISNANCMHLKIAVRIRSCQFSANKHLTFILRCLIWVQTELRTREQKKSISEFIVNPSARKIQRILDDVTHLEVVSRCQQSSSISFVLVSLSPKMQTLQMVHMNKKNQCALRLN